MEYCCEFLQRSIEWDEMTYNPVSGCFWFYIKDEAWGGPGTFHQRHCAFCPFCGAKLPINRLELQKDGSDIYTAEIERAVGKDWCDIKEDEIPEEFKTDEWWVKRGL